VLCSFAAAFLRPQLLRLAYQPSLIASHPPPGLPSLRLVGSRLLHLELSAPSLLAPLDALVGACPQLRCLSLRGCTALNDASMAPITQLTSLQALDLAGLPALTDATIFHVAKLPLLTALNLTGTGVTGRCLDMLTYGHRCGACECVEGVGCSSCHCAQAHWCDMLYGLCQCWCFGHFLFISQANLHPH